MTSEDREERLFRLSEALEQAYEQGEFHEDSVWALRFDLEISEVARARRAIELLAGTADQFEIADDLPLPELPEDYVLEEELGRGGMGVVYRVHQKSLNRDLALKVLRPGEAVARRALERFKREARSLARLRHPHIASVHEVGEFEGRVFFTMDLIRGRSLAQLIAEKSATPTQAVRWMRQVAAAIQYVHGHGLVHRDIKPANILIDESGDACVVDFGLAREVDVTSDLTQSGHFLGTPSYMSPEQARGESELVGESTDVYAIGVVFYECLTGKKAFRGNSIVELIAAVCAGNATPPRRIDPMIPVGLERICLKAMATAPEDRYVTARALLEDLERFEAGRRVLAEPPSLASRWRSFSSRHRSSMRASLLTAALVAGFFVLFVFPLIPTGEESLLAKARELQEEGESFAAVRLYEESFPEEVDLESLKVHGIAFANALLAAADESLADGDSDAATRHVEVCRDLVERAVAHINTVSNAYGVQDAELLSLRFHYLSISALASARMANSPDLEAALEELGDELAVEALGKGGGQIPERYAALGNRHGLVEIMLAESSLEALLDSEDSGHPAAVALWARALAGRARGDFRSWMRDSLEEPERVLIALLGAAAQVNAEEAEWSIPRLDGPAKLEWMQMVEACDARALRKGLQSMGESSRFERSANGGAAVRAAYVEFVAQLVDLPAALVEFFEPTDLAAHLELTSREPSRSLEHRIELALAALAADPVNGAEPFRSWIRSRTGFGTPRVDGDLVEAWKNWQQAQTPASLREQLERSLSLQDSESLTGSELLREFDACVDKRNRRLFHELMLLGLPPAAVAPFWPNSFSSAQEPDHLARDWAELLREPGPARTWRVRIAGLHWSLGDLEPRVRWEDQIEVAEGDDLRHEFEYSFALLDREDTWYGRLFQDWVPLETRGPGEVAIELRGSLAARWGGVHLDWESPTPPRSVRRFQARLNGETAQARPGQVIAVGLFEAAQPAARVAEDFELVVARFEPVDHSPVAWTAAQWTSNLKNDLVELLNSVEFHPRLDRFSDLDRRREGRLAQGSWMARLLLPEEEFEAFATRSGVPTLRGLLGDAYWTRWLLTTRDESQHARAAQALNLDQAPSEMRSRLVRLAREHGGLISESDASLLRREEEAQRRSNRKYLVLKILGGVIVFIVVGGLVGGLVSLYRRWRSGDLRERLAQVSREAHLVGALTMMPGGCWWVWYLDMQFARHLPGMNSIVALAMGAALAWYAVTFLYLGLFLRGKWRLAPAVFFSIACLMALLQTLGIGTPASTTIARHGSIWAYGFAGWFFWFGLASLPAALHELWAWHPDPQKGQRLERRATTALVILGLIPLGWQVLGLGSTSLVSSYPWLTRVGSWSYLVPLVGTLLWAMWLGQAIKYKKTEVYELAKQQEKARWRNKNLASKA